MNQNPTRYISLNNGEKGRFSLFVFLNVMSVVKYSLFHNFGRLLGYHRLYNNPFYLVLSSATFNSWANKVSSLLSSIFLPLLLSTSSFSFHTVLQNAELSLHLMGSELNSLNTGTGFNDQGPVVQRILSLTSSLRGQLVKCFGTL